MIQTYKMINWIRWENCTNLIQREKYEEMIIKDRYVNSPAYNGEQYEGPEVEEAEDHVPGGQRAGRELELADDPAREDETHGHTCNG